MTKVLSPGSMGAIDFAMSVERQAKVASPQVRFHLVWLGADADHCGLQAL
jgi:hypothetical protein